MGLTGTWTKYTYSEHETNTQELSITNPDGTTETATVPEIVTSTEDINCYIVITNFMFYKNVTDSNDNYLFDFTYRVYNSKTEKNADIDNFIHEDSILGQYRNVLSTDDIRQKAYELLKNEQGFTNLIDD